MKNKSDMKKWLPILGVAAVVLVILAVVFGRMGGDGKAGGEDKNPAVSQEETQAAVSEAAKQNGEETDAADGSEEGIEENKEEETRGALQVVERVEATYEEWLASAAVIGISMQYPEFDFKGIYLASETELNDHADSKGVYVLFACEGNEILLQSVPLEAERTEAGTIDLSENELGFATFDEVSKADVDVSGMKEVTMEDLTKTISQSLLVSLYEH